MWELTHFVRVTLRFGKRSKLFFFGSKNRFFVLQPFQLKQTKHT
ncbi:hypothetical protein LEP1GSC173_1860 [Leptospira interrogans str. HAI1594]|uniref:Uncharacterized protein n=1 Tax=Leptospira interrogans serovar Hardjo str. Norma TaxID=1279460 RepID=A0A0M5LDA0_LEPIR|nr:hypothetical protein G436_2045 [Leptospira interrogans serovar Hardjo str. Norma]EKP75809.1 hypothetical protein LEP1GSC173_1860 [Leptospira interrogans str. HAI1594]EMJ73768.1 hypothetical protein LEP1GSC033_3370 [Leptospira interrogans str. 2002000632]EMJ78493.1 hypothetical protein LEP1GSC032_3492 [Leptospira interrogans str. 2002000631]EMO16687.1 hypothetical protein LEP1GSC167_0676 [Leptospira interrogans serovar Copenhageni str. HAI0188]